MNALAWVLLGELGVALAALALGLALAGRRRSRRQWAALEKLLDGVARGEKRRRLELQEGLESRHGLDAETAERVGAALYAEEKAFLRELVPLLAGGDPAQLAALHPALTTLMDRQLAVLGEAQATAPRLEPWPDEPPPEAQDATAMLMEAWNIPADDTAREAPEPATAEDTPWPEDPPESAGNMASLETWDAPDDDTAADTPPEAAEPIAGETDPPAAPESIADTTALETWDAPDDDMAADTPPEAAEPMAGETDPSIPESETALLMAAWQGMMADDTPIAAPEPTAQPDPTHK
ncbi:hypothetical protein SAMN02949497_4339 [Methylomagnum ishizawai]|uniref:Uncharacterized protein n=1 Tax=Methylomagnum ishizawai TaxID=1760988 RepID=A0A1Y6DBB9_9GAMM|nr:hypothetical protein [Methylomagnum ishizawai]SMF96925.1 hypothetical protein SAMN02949497_4339 [Methylomagnum ishizawai]